MGLNLTAPYVDPQGIHTKHENIGPRPTLESPTSDDRFVLLHSIFDLYSTCYLF